LVVTNPELLERVAQLRDLVRTPKEIARVLGIPAAEVVKRRLAGFCWRWLQAVFSWWRVRVLGRPWR
jgi:hypothetical protein